MDSVAERESGTVRVETPCGRSSRCRKLVETEHVRVQVLELASTPKPNAEVSSPMSQLISVAALKILPDHFDDRVSTYTRREQGEPSAVAKLASRVEVDCRGGGQHAIWGSGVGQKRIDLSGHYGCTMKSTDRCRL